MAKKGPKKSAQVKFQNFPSKNVPLIVSPASFSLSPSPFYGLIGRLDFFVHFLLLFVTILFL